MKEEIYEDEIDLRELFLTLRRNLKFIIGFTVFITIIAIVVVLLKQPIYEVKSNILVGFIEKNVKGFESKKVNIDRPEVIVKKLRLIFNVDDEVKTKKKFISKISDISVNKKLNNFILIKIEAINNKEGLKLNKKVVKFLIDMYKPKIKQYITNQENEIKIILEGINRIDNFEIKNTKEKIRILKTQKIEKIKEEIEFFKKVTLSSIDNKIKINNTKIDEYNKILEKLYKDASKSTDTTAQAIYSMQMLNYQNLILNSQNKLEDLKVDKKDINEKKIINLQRDIDNINSEEIRKLQYKIDNELINKKIKLQNKIDMIRYNISDQNIKNSQVVGDYIVKDNPIKPKKKLIVIISFITAFMLSIFIVFFREFISTLKYKEEEEK